MSDSTAHTPRPVALITTLFIFALATAGFFVVQRFYRPSASAPQNSVAENLPKDLAWKATPASRKEALGALREKQAKQATSYAWLDQKAGVIQLPIDRAMQLTAEQYGSKK
jgi:hypothetical protein